MTVKNANADTPHVMITHDEGQSPKFNGKSVIIKLAIAVALGAAIFALPRPAELPPEGHRLAAILVPVIFLWVSEAIPIGITALLATASMIAFKVTSAQAGLGPLRQPSGYVRYDDHYVRRGA